ncbi:MAG: purine-binding chemotaxis protein CheW [Salinivirgaceae bacterium]|nr:purine-binding chemotaxis protein CheW [Salinivirgaceae bacterium]
MSEKTKMEINTYLTFNLGEETFASNVSKVLNILEMMKITEVPQSPDYMRGVVNLRGEVLPLIDTRIKFGMTPISISSATCILVLNVNVNSKSVKIGTLVDSVHEVLEVKEEDILAPPDMGTKYKSEFIEGLIKSGDGFIMLLDMDKIFSTDEITILQEKTEEPILEETSN